ncbi:MAG TPA: hypothetical protein VFG59_04015 [Anaeromyxobacter sp.]|nr:hypothetical protein [Anaeromyxobacter sp.]
MTPLLIGLAVLVVAWFAAGSIFNVRRGREALRWLQDGLPLLGARTTVRWLGTSAVQLSLAQPLAPFEELALIVFLEPRDLPWMWLAARGAGRRDTLILRAQLRAPPRLDLEALDPRSWSGREALPRLPPAEWSARPAATGELTLHTPRAQALARAEALLELARRTGVAVRRLSVRRGRPHLQLHLALPDPAVPARRLFEAVRALGEGASH